jgi:hypothetical protein
LEVVDFLLSSLGEDGLGGRLMLEYQKSLPAQSILTQLRTAVMVLGSFRAPKVEQSN